MAGISNEEITEIRKKADIVEVIGSYINLAPQGKNYFGICPFHNDHSPSLSVSREKQIYKCFTCLASGNVFTFVQNYENISFIEAVKKVADKINYKLDIKDKIVNKNSKYYELMDLSNKIFVNNLNSNLGLKAKEYLINERHLSEEAIKEFNIGLALNDNNLNKLLSSKGYSDKDIIEMSLANKTDNGLLDMFRNRITFPICNHEGKIIAYSARIYQNEDTSKYINSKESVIFKKGYTFYNYDKCRLEALKIKSVILVEGQMDAIRVYTSGFKNDFVYIASFGNNSKSMAWSPVSDKGFSLGHQKKKYFVENLYKKNSISVQYNPDLLYLNSEKLNNNLPIESWAGPSSYPIAFGFYGNNGYRMKGKIYSIRIYNRALTEDEIKNNYIVDKARFGIK